MNLSFNRINLSVTHNNTTTEPRVLTNYCWRTHSTKARRALCNEMRLTTLTEDRVVVQYRAPCRVTTAVYPSSSSYTVTFNPIRSIRYVMPPDPFTAVRYIAGLRRSFAVKHDFFIIRIVEDSIRLSRRDVIMRDRRTALKERERERENFANLTKH